MCHCDLNFSAVHLVVIPVLSVSEVSASVRERVSTRKFGRSHVYVMFHCAHNTLLLFV